ncbi:MAG: extracellular solute-binding protein [Acholeplasmatales bacterium]|jgi:spermidine/putrescine-binding protein|nr:extracellular solute-binding protein [Acholeplasmatales bacterium]
MLKSKLFLTFLVLCLLTLFLGSCSNRQTLLLLNWGEYINEDLITKFEEEYGVEVKMSLADSNELFYSKVMGGTTVYDLVIPSDYMIEKMAKKDLIQEIDYTKLDNWNSNNPLTPGVADILNSLTSFEFQGTTKEAKDYCVPYFWGTFGIMYRKTPALIASGIEDPSKALDVYFNEASRPAGTRIGMYDSPRFSYAAALQYLGLNFNDYSKELLAQAKTVLANSRIHEWGFDTLKKNILSNNLDLAYTWTGDMLDMLYMRLDEGQSIQDIDFDIVIPDNSIAFMDAFVIPKKSRNSELAYKFIDFFLDPLNAYENASTVGYCTPVVKAYNWIVDPQLALNDGVIDAQYYLEEESWLNSWSYANNRYYPLTSPGSFNGISLSDFDTKIIDLINQMINQIKTS